MHDSDASLLEPLLSPALDSLFRTPRRLGKPSGWWGHVPFAFWIVQATEPRLLVELGTHHGVSYAAVCDAVRAKTATLGGSISREAGPIKGGNTIIAFITDPDGYKIELIERPEAASELKST